MKKLTLFLSLIITLSSIFFVTGCSPNDNNKHTDNVSITLWHYYNDKQLSPFNQLIDDFNKTVGREENIEVTAQSKYNIKNLSTDIINAAQNKVGAPKMPDMFMSYADTVYVVDKLGKVASLDNYFTKEELGEYLPSFLNDGRLGEDSSLKIFPIAKASELFVINKTDWEKFTKENPDVSDSEFATIEGIIRVSEKYYNWTNALTPDIPDDGKAFYSRDSLSNYFILGAKQLGIDLMQIKDGVFSFNFDKAIIKKLWECFYVPYVKGYFYSSAGFRSTDVSNGDILAYTGSSSSAVYFPTKVIINDDLSYDIDYAAYKAPIFEEGIDLAIQQGAGIAVTKSTTLKEKACCTFLKWFTQKDINAKFSARAAYVPVKVSTLSSDYLDDPELGINKINKDMLKKTIDIMLNTNLYTNIPSEYSGDIREQVLDVDLENQAKTDRALLLEDIKNGMSYSDAVNKYCSNDSFEKWFNNFKKEIEDLYLVSSSESL